jgi:hypothetical protein
LFAVLSFELVSPSTICESRRGSQFIDNEVDTQNAEYPVSVMPDTGPQARISRAPASQRKKRPPVEVRFRKRDRFEYPLLDLARITARPLGERVHLAKRRGAGGASIPIMGAKASGLSFNKIYFSLHRGQYRP